MQAVRPGDVVILRDYDPNRDSGFTEAACLCLWVKHHRSNPPPRYDGGTPESYAVNWYVEFGGLELGRDNLVQRMIQNNEPVEFPWPTAR